MQVKSGAVRNIGEIEKRHAILYLSAVLLGTVHKRFRKLVGNAVVLYLFVPEIGSTLLRLCGTSALSLGFVQLRPVGGTLTSVYSIRPAEQLAIICSFSGTKLEWSLLMHARTTHLRCGCENGAITQPRATQHRAQQPA